MASFRTHVASDPVYQACENGNLHAVDLYLKKGNDVNKPDHNGQTLLFIACKYGYAPLVNALLRQDGIDINKADNEGRTPLYEACKGHSEVVNLLLEQEGIDVNQADNDGWTPLHLACSWGYLLSVNALLRQNGIDINKADNKGRTPLWIAAAANQNNLAIVNALLRQDGIDINKADNEGRTPVDIVPEWDQHRKRALIRGRERQMMIEVLNHKDVDQGNAGKRKPPKHLADYAATFFDPKAKKKLRL